VTKDHFDGDGHPLVHLLLAVPGLSEAPGCASLCFFFVGLVVQLEPSLENAVCRPLTAVFFQDFV